jgi:hypothetical protein
VILLRKLMDYAREDLDFDDFKEIYPDLLKRLDDA